MKTHTLDDRNEVIIELLSQIENYKAALGKITGDINHHKNMLEAIAFAEKIIALLSQDNAEDIAAAYTKLDRDIIYGQPFNRENDLFYPESSFLRSVLRQIKINGTVGQYCLISGSHRVSMLANDFLLSAENVKMKTSVLR